MNSLRKLFFLIIGVVTLSLVTGLIATGWTGPGDAAPYSNAPAPVNIGSDSQTKDGEFISNSKITAGSFFTAGNIEGTSLDVGDFHVVSQSVPVKIGPDGVVSDGYVPINLLLSDGGIELHNSKIRLGGSLDSWLIDYSGSTDDSIRFSRATEYTTNPTALLSSLEMEIAPDKVDLFSNDLFTSGSVNATSVKADNINYIIDSEHSRQYTLPNNSTNATTIIETTIEPEQIGKIYKIISVGEIQLEVDSGGFGSSFTYSININNNDVSFVEITPNSDLTAENLLRVRFEITTYIHVDDTGVSTGRAEILPVASLSNKKNPYAYSWRSNYTSSYYDDSYFSGDCSSLDIKVSVDPTAFGDNSYAKIQFTQIEQVHNFLYTPNPSY